MKSIGRNLKSNSEIKKIQNLMELNGVECWLMLNYENTDPYFKKYISNKTSAPAVSVITQENCHVIVHELDWENIRDKEVFEYKTGSEFYLILEEVFKNSCFPKKIFLNYSTMHDVNVDVLGYGRYLNLTKRIKNIYKKNKKSVCFASAEKLVYALCDQKDKRMIGKMEIASNRALEILEEVFCKIKIGMSEKDVVNLAHDIFLNKPKYFDKKEIVLEEFAWNKEGCPVVLTGSNLKKGGHSVASDEKIKKGNTVYLDFGVCLTFKDGTKVSSDLQRMGYVLNNNENEPPSDIKKVFNTLVEAVEFGIKKIKPGIKGYEIDRIVRKKITDAGYPDYNHATGHAIGEKTHNPGTLLGNKESKKANLLIQDGGVYTIEPRISICNGGSIEEMVYVTKLGNKTLCKPQKELYLIK